MPGRPPPAHYGLAYHRMALAGRPGWWRPVLGTLLIAVFTVLLLLVLIAGFAIAAALGGVPVDWESEGALFADPIWETAATLAMIGVLLPAILLAARVVRRRRGTVSSVAGRLRWGWLARCAVVAVPIVIAVLIGLVLLYAIFPPAGEPPPTDTAGWTGWRTFLVGAAVLVALVPVQAAAEEYLVRGWIPQFFGSYLRSPWYGIVVGAVAFALLHGLSEPAGFLGLVYFGLLFGWLAVRTGGLEAAVAYHVVNNLAAFLLSAAFGGLDQDLETSAADADWRFPLVELVLLPAYAAVVVWWHRRSGALRTSPDSDGGVALHVEQIGLPVPPQLGQRLLTKGVEQPQLPERDRDQRDQV